MPLAVFTSVPTTGDYTWDALEAICARIGAHAGWDRVEVFNPDASKRLFVVKCLAASSGLPKDFYVIFQSGNGSATATWMIAEDYDVATHSVRRAYMAVGVQAASLTTADGSLSGDTWTVLPDGMLANNGNSSRPKWQGCIDGVVGTAQEFVLSVQKDCLVLMPRGMSAHWIGKFTSLVTNAVVNDPMPLFALNEQTTDPLYDIAYSMGTARQPFRLNATLRHSGVLWSPFTQYFSTWANKMSPGEALGNTGDLFRDGKTPLWALPVLSYTQNSADSNTATHGWLRGKIESMRYCQLPGGAGGYLDSMVVDGEAWAYLTGGRWVSVTA